MINWTTPFFSDNLLGLLMQGVLLAEFAILLHLDAVGSVLFVFVCPVVTIFAFGTGQGDIRPHDCASVF